MAGKIKIVYMGEEMEIESSSPLAKRMEKALDEWQETAFKEQRGVAWIEFKKSIESTLSNLPEGVAESLAGESIIFRFRGDGTFHEAGMYGSKYIKVLQRASDSTEG
jgi:hypothetical protein